MKKLLLSAVALMAMIGCEPVAVPGEDSKDQLYGEWTTLDQERDVRTDILFRDDLTYESTIQTDPEIRENGTWDLQGEILVREPSKCYVGASSTTCSNRNNGNINFTEDGFEIEIHKVDYELNIDTTYVIVYESK